MPETYFQSVATEHAANINPAESKLTKKVFAKIKSSAYLKRADIYFADEAGIRSDYHSGITWTSKGETPVVQATGARFSVNMISAVHPRGDFRFMLVDGGRPRADFGLVFANKSYRRGAAFSNHETGELFDKMPFRGSLTCFGSYKIEYTLLK